MENVLSPAMMDGAVKNASLTPISGDDPMSVFAKIYGMAQEVQEKNIAAMHQICHSERHIAEKNQLMMTFERINNNNNHTAVMVAFIALLGVVYTSNKA